MTPSFFLSITDKYSFFIRQVGFQMYIIYYMKPKRRNDKKVVYRWRIKLRCGKQDRGFFCTMTLYNNLEKGCSAAWQRVCFGYKMSRVQILSSLSLTITYHMIFRIIFRIIYLLYEMSNKTGPIEDEFQLDIHTEYLYVYILIQYIHVKWIWII